MAGDRGHPRAMRLLPFAAAVRTLALTPASYFSVIGEYS
jgi:hypothetical protein